MQPNELAKGAKERKENLQKKNIAISPNNPRCLQAYTHTIKRNENTKLGIIIT